MSKVIKLPSRVRRGSRMNDGRAYFKKLASEYHIDGLDPDAIADKPLPRLKRGPAESKRGGRITRDLKRVEPNEAAEHREQSEEFLKRPAHDFPADT
jgi:hypothetical protein